MLVLQLAQPRSTQIGEGKCLSGNNDSDLILNVPLLISIGSLIYIQEVFVLMERTYFLSSTLVTTGLAEILFEFAIYDFFVPQ